MRRFWAAYDEMRVTIGAILLSAIRAMRRPKDV
jgi:hypothetical protein